MYIKLVFIKTNFVFRFIRNISPRQNTFFKVFPQKFCNPKTKFRNMKSKKSKQQSLGDELDYAYLPHVDPKPIHFDYYVIFISVYAIFVHTASHCTSFLGPFLYCCCWQLLPLSNLFTQSINTIFIESCLFVFPSVVVVDVVFPNIGEWQQPCEAFNRFIITYYDYISKSSSSYLSDVCVVCLFCVCTFASLLVLRLFLFLSALSHYSSVVPCFSCFWMWHIFATVIFITLLYT